MPKLIALVSMALLTFGLACSQPIDIREAHCQQGDMESYNRAGTDLWKAEDWGAIEAYSTEWTHRNNPGNKVRCLTLIYDSVEEARWALNYSTALQRAYSGKSLPSHRQIIAPRIGQDALAFEVDGKRLATTVMFRQETIVVMVETNSSINPWLRQQIKWSAVGEPTRIAHAIDNRIPSD